MDSGFKVLDSGFLNVSGTRIPDSNHQSGFLQLSSGFESPGFRIPQAKISRIPESGLPYVGQGSFYVSGKLPTYPSPKPTLTLMSHLGQNVGLRGRGGWAVSQKRTHINNST